ncbi:unnamed protein product [Rhodiola kirilowii]
MSTGGFLNIHPSELKFPFEEKKQSSCCMQLTNKTDEYVAFKVKTTNPKKYCVRPNAGIVLPGSTCNVTVTMQAQKEAPPDMQCKDKFLLQSVVAPSGTAAKDITSEMFNKEEGKAVEEFKLRVVYIAAKPPSPVPEGSEEGSSPRASAQDNGSAPMFDSVSRSLDEPKEKSSETWSAISKLTDEKASAIQQNQRLRQELELIRKEISRSSAGGVSFVFVVLIGLIGILAGYMKVDSILQYCHFPFSILGTKFIFSQPFTVPTPTIPSHPTFPTKPAKCPKDTLKFGVCGSWLGLVHEVIGTPPSKECCTLISGLADAEAALCLCTAIKANVLGVVKLKVPVAVSMIVSGCGKKIPKGFKCA